MDTVEMPERLAEDLIMFVRQAIGDEWLNSGRGLALRVPSVHSQSDTNILFNPEHPDIRHVRLLARSPYQFDHRLL